MTCSTRFFAALSCLFLFSYSISVASEESSDPLVRIDLGTDFEVLPAGRDTGGVLRVCLVPEHIAVEQDRPPVNLAVVIDRSGSMAGKKLEQAKKGAIEALRRLDRRDRFTLISYNQDVTTDFASAPVTNGKTIERVINNLRASGNTAIYAGLNQAAAEIRKSLDHEMFNRIILLSDGLANTGPSTPADFERLGRAFRREDISVSSIGIGQDFDENVLVAVSEAGDGNFYVAEVADDLPRFFDAELGDVTSVVARDVVIEIFFENGFSPVGTVGRVGRIEGQSVQFEISQLYGGNSKFGLIEYRANPGEDQESKPLARVKIHYRDAMSGKEMVLEDSASVSFSADTEVVSSSGDLVVNRDYAENLLASKTREAFAYQEEGDHKSAGGVFSSVSAPLSSLNAVLKDEYIDELIAESEGRQLRFGANDLSRSEKLGMEARAYESLNQQSTGSDEGEEED